MLTSHFRLLLADDYKLVRRGLRSLLEDHPDVLVVGDVDGSAVLESATELRPDVILFDVRTPRHEDGLKAISQIHQYLPATRVVVCTVADDMADVAAQAFEAGAVGFISKTRCNAQEVAEELRNAARGQSLLTIEGATGSFAHVPMDTRFPIQQFQY